MHEFHYIIQIWKIVHELIAAFATISDIALQFRWNLTPLSGLS